MISSAQATGFAAENFARDYLLHRGLKLVTQNYHERCGEIDLIMLDQEILVFVEVRYRNKSSHGNSLESIHAHKRRRIIRTAEIFLLRHREYYDSANRFDVLALDGLSKPHQIEWIKDAFLV